MELIIAIAFFAVSSAICVQLFAMAHTLSSRSVGVQMAVMNAQSAAETFKASGGDTAVMSSVLEAAIVGEQLVVHFDENWGRTDYNTRFEMVVSTDMSSALATASITVTDSLLGEELYSLTVLRYMGVN